MTANMVQGPFAFGMEISGKANGYGVRLNRQFVVNTPCWVEMSSASIICLMETYNLDAVTAAMEYFDFEE